MNTKNKNLPSADKPSARERLLQAANELFYKEGVHTVGIDRIIERAGVAKATLYSTFGSKDELIRAYLTTRHMTWREFMDKQLANFDTPKERLLGVFDLQGRVIKHPEFYGCAFMNANAEGIPSPSIEEPTEAYRNSVRELFVLLAQEAGASDPENLAGQLILLFDGAMIAARLDKRLDAAATARSVAVTLIDAAIGK